MAMSSELRALLEQAKVPETFIAYLDTLGVEDAFTFALLADDEKSVKTELCKESGVLLNAMEIVAVKKAWIWARAEVPDPNKSSASSSAFVEPTMPPGTEERIG